MTGAGGGGTGSPDRDDTTAAEAVATDPTARGGDGGTRRPRRSDRHTRSGPFERPGGAEAPRARRSDRRAPSAARRRSRRSRRGGARHRRRGRPARRVRARRGRRRHRLRRAAGLLVAAVVAVGTVVGAGRLVAPSPEPAEAPPTVPSPVDPADPQPAVVLATYDEEQPAAGASRIAVLAYDRARERGTILLVPSSTVTDIPGHGLLEIGRAYGFGAGPLLDASLDNLLGVDLDHVAGVSRQGWAALLDRVGGLTVDVRERLDAPAADGGVEVRFQPGEQFLDGQRLAELLTLDAAGQSELDALARTQHVLVALLDRLHAEPELLERAFADGAPMLDTAAPGAVAEVLGLLADARARSALSTVTLPVSPIGGEDETYRVDAERAEALAAERLSGSRPATVADAGRALQILNGNGTPGIGQEVAERLVPAGYRVVLTGNADRFDHPTTRIVVYEDSPEQLEVARDIRDRLGVGEVELSGSPQSVVDVTVVVGRDFPARG